VSAVLAEIAGHAFTIGPEIYGLLRPPRAPAARHFAAAVEDARLGSIRLSGLLHEIPGADTLALIVHGLAGSAASPYCARAASAAAAAGISSLRLSLRGADRSGEDLFHGGLTADLWAALASPALARYAKVVLLGYSVGGHIALRAAVERADRRLVAAAAICPPLDLGVAADALDAPSRRFYRSRVFAGLDASYAATAARRGLPVPPAVVRRARSCRHRDEMTVVPRFGFASAAEYYARESVAARLHRLEVPTLFVASRTDPIIARESVEPALAEAPRAMTVRWVDRGGHVHFPRDLDLGYGAAPGLEPQVMRWLTSQR
jgi:hypothetical protein